MENSQGARIRALGAFVLSAALTCFVIAVVARFVATIVAGPRQMLFDIVYRITWALSLLGVFSLLAAFLDGEEGSLLRAQGFPPQGWLRQLSVGVAMGAVLVTLAVSVLLLFGEVRHVHFFDSTHALRWALEALIVLIAGSLAEELSFRGYPFQKLVAAVGPVWAIVAFSVLFALAHSMNPGVTVLAVINTVAIGVLFALAYLRTRALWLPWGLHFGWNFTLGMVCGLPVSGLKTFSAMVRTTVSGPLWVTGGSYGIEGSLTGTVVIGLGMLGLWRLPARSLTGKSLPPSNGTRFSGV